LTSTVWLKCSVSGNGKDVKPYRPIFSDINDAYAIAHAGEPKYDCSLSIIYEPDKKPYSFCIVKVESENPLNIAEVANGIEVLDTQEKWNTLYLNYPNLKKRFRDQPAEVVFDERTATLTVDPNETALFDPDETRFFTSTPEFSTTQTEVATPLTASYAVSDQQTNVQSNVYVYAIDTTNTQIGTNVAKVIRAVGSGNAGGYQTNTWDCPLTSLNATDTINVNVLAKTNTSTNRLTFATEQLGANALSSATWTFNYYTNRTSNATYTSGVFRYGDLTTRNSQVNNFTWTAAVAAGAAVKLRRLLMGIGRIKEIHNLQKWKNNWVIKIPKIKLFLSKKFWIDKSCRA